MRTVAVVLAGGAGQRFGSEMPKQMHVLAGRSLVEHSVAAFEQADAVEEIMVVMPAGLTAQARARGVTPEELAYDLLLQENGRNMLFLAAANYGVNGNRDCQLIANR